MKRILQGIATLGVSAAACKMEPPKPTAPAVAPSEEMTLADELARDALYDAHPVRRTLYTWTTHDQVAELSHGKPLLSREESPTRGMSYFEKVVEALDRQGDAVAKLLFTTTFAKSRFAWHAPWATRRGWPGEEYGDELVRVTLRPDAVILALSTTTGTFTARDLEDREVALADVLAHPERIGGVYFTSDAQAARRDLPRSAATYREVVLCNESMIESWAVGDDEIARELAREARLIDALARYVRDHHPTRPGPREVWAERVPEPSVAHRYTASLALDNSWYAMDADAMVSLATLLRRTPRAITITRAPPRAFPGVGPRRAGSRPAPQWSASYGTYAPAPRKP